MNELEFEQQLYDILDIYTEHGEFDLDGDEVDVLVNRLRNQLNLICGNITNDEYVKLDVFSKEIEEMRTYIYDDYHRLEDFTDIEVCNEDDLKRTEDLTDTYLDIYLTSDDIQQMYGEFKSGCIDLVKWGMLALERGGVE